MTVKYEDIKPGAAEFQEEPDTARMLDEVTDFISAHVVADDTAIRTMALFAAMTWAKDAFSTIPRLIFKTREAGLEGRNHGKTTALRVVASLCASPTDARGTYAALRAELAAAHNEGGVRTFTYDRVEQVYGTSGTNRGGNSTLTILLEGGYKEDAYDSWSVNRTSQRFPLFYPMILTGNGTALASDILERCVVINMIRGRPSRYFSIRESQAEAKDLGRALGAAVRIQERLDELTAFRATGVDEHLVQRLQEVWEPLFAVAWVLGGQRWLNWCLEAFRALALDAEQSALSPRQQVIRDAAGLLDSAFKGKKFIGGLALTEQMKQLQNPLYEERSAAGLSRLVSDAMPVDTKQVRINGQKIRGYYARDIARAWADIRPADLADAEILEEKNVFEITDDNEDVTDVLE